MCGQRIYSIFFRFRTPLLGYIFYEIPKRTQLSLASKKDVKIIKQSVNIFGHDLYEQSIKHLQHLLDGLVNGSTPNFLDFRYYLLVIYSMKITSFSNQRYVKMIKRPVNTLKLDLYEQHLLMLNNIHPNFLWVCSILVWIVVY